MKIKQQPNRNKVIRKKQTAKPETQPLLRDAEFANLPIDQIEFSPLNYRKYYSETALNDFADELKQHGIISPLTVRSIAKDKYQLIAGERRLRAARIAGLATIPVAIVSLTNEQVTEIQLAENLQRENPHPMDEAQAVQLMLDSGKKLDEIAMRLGKSRQFVFLRLKLIKLIEPLRPLFYQNKMTLQEAVELAMLSPQAQEAFFESECSDWEKDSFELNDLQWTLRKFKYDLTNAPFNTKDKKLLPDAGACTGCPFNSASLKSLFPELAKQAVCSNTGCYQNKVDTAWRLRLLDAFLLDAPLALIAPTNQLQQVTLAIKAIPQMVELPIHEYSQVTVLEKPAPPDPEDYVDYDDEGTETPDQEALAEAVAAYEEELAEYEKLLAAGEAIKGLYIRRDELLPVLFTSEPPSQRNDYGTAKKISQKDLQEAINAKTVTADMYRQVIGGMQEREQRSLELDEEKIQLEIHRQLHDATTDFMSNEGLTEADQAAAAFLIYQGLDYMTRRIIHETLLDKIPAQSTVASEDIYRKLAGLTEQQYSYLIRTALLSKPDSKSPGQQAGYQLQQMATQASVNVSFIREAQQRKAEDRQERLKTRVTELETKARRLEKKQD